MKYICLSVFLTSITSQSDWIPQMSINALLRTRRERRGCNRCVPWAGSLSLGRYPAYAKHSEAGPEWYGIFRRLTVESRPSQCPSTASASFTTA